MLYRKLGVVAAAMFAVATLMLPPPAAAQDHQTSVTVNGGGKPVRIMLTEGQSASVRLGFQAGTGYVWVPVPSEQGVVMLGKSREVDKSGRPGGAAVQVFDVTPKAKGTTTLEFHYRQPWDKKAPPARRWRLSVTVE